MRPRRSESVRLLGAAGGALVGDVGGGRSALEQQRALASLDRIDLQDGAREPQPGRGVGRSRCDDLSEQRHAAAEVVALERRIGVALERRDRLRRRTRVGLDLGFELDGAFSEGVVLESFVGGNGGETCK